MATAMANRAGGADPELQERIARHQEARGVGWSVVEPGPALWNTPRAAVDEAACHGQGLLFDCLTLWVSGCLEYTWSDAVVMRQAGELLRALAALSMPVAVVTNELGLGLVPADAVSRRFRDLAGLVNQAAAELASEAVFVVSGLPLVLKRDGRPMHSLVEKC